MFFRFFSVELRRITYTCKCLLTLAAIVAMLSQISAALPSQQDQSSQPDSQQNPNQQEAPPEAGGPNSDTGPYAIPKKGEEPPPPPVERPKKVEGMPDYSIHVDVPLVTVPVMVTTKDGQFIPNLKKDNFKIFEDGAAQKIDGFKIEEAPITAVLLVEFASTNYFLLSDTLNAFYYFAQSLKRDDYVAIIAYDMKPDLLLDFTTDKNAVLQTLNGLRIPGF